MSIYLLRIDLTLNIAPKFYDQNCKLELSMKNVNGFQNLFCAKSCRNIPQIIAFCFLYVCVVQIHTVFIKFVQWLS